MRRVSRRVPMDVLLNHRFEGMPYLVRSRDVSMTGIFVERVLSPHFRHGSRVVLEFALPGEERPIWADAQIMRSEGEGLGLRFVNLSPRASSKIKSYIDGAPSVVTAS